MIRLFGGKQEPADSGEPEEKLSFFQRMKQAVSRTHESLTSKIEGIVALTRTVDENALDDLELALLSSDLGVQTTATVIDALRERAMRRAIEGGEELPNLLKTELQAILEAPQRPI